MTNTEINQEAPDKLSREKWRFYYDDRYHVLRLTHHLVETRPSTRHKFRLDAEKSWDAYHRNYRPIPQSEPLLSDDVWRQALANFTKELGVVVGFSNR